MDALEIKAIKDEIINKDVFCNEKLWLKDWGCTVEKYEQKERVGIVKKEENKAAIKEKRNYRAKAINFPCFKSADR